MASSDGRRRKRRTHWHSSNCSGTSTAIFQQRRFGLAAVDSSARSAAFRPHSFIILVAVAHLVRWWLALLAALRRGRTARPLRDRAVTPLDRACSASQPHTTHSETLTSTPDTAHSSCYWQASLTLVVSVVERDMRAARKLPRHERRRLVVHSIRLRLPKRLVELRQPAHLDVFDADRILPCLCETPSVR